MTERRTYHQMIAFPTFEERYNYLRLTGRVGADTFGFDRYLNQSFYRSKEWKDIRQHVIARDSGCDLGDPERPIFGRVLVHHMNPILPEDLEDFNPEILDPEYLVCVTHETHNAIHYGDPSSLIIMPKERRPNDTIPWR